MPHTVSRIWQFVETQKEMVSLWLPRYWSPRCAHADFTKQLFDSREGAEFLRVLEEVYGYALVDRAWLADQRVVPTVEEAAVVQKGVESILNRRGD